jgi:hypothetical protein
MNSEIETGAVIACAASKDNSVFRFYYPENGAKNIKYYETLSMNLDANDYENHTQRGLDTAPVFNGYLEKFISNLAIEKWVIITFELDDGIKISNPIRIKHVTKPTVWNENVTIDQSEIAMPNFSWVHNSEEGNAIYFEVISDTENNLLSGTYTYQNNFQYYNLENVVLNITTQSPPELIVNNGYNFTLMDVSEDNWVNLVIQKLFIIQ